MKATEICSAQVLKFELDHSAFAMTQERWGDALRESEIWSRRGDGNRLGQVVGVGRSQSLGFGRMETRPSTSERLANRKQLVKGEDSLADSNSTNGGAFGRDGDLTRPERVINQV